MMLQCALWAHDNALYNIPIQRDKYDVEPTLDVDCMACFFDGGLH